MQLQQQYDVAILGGGLAGLACSILLKKMGHEVIVFEKEQYPFHKVCGEYISFESWDFLKSLGIPLQEMDLPKIDTLLLTAPNGNSFKTKLPLGGFGISRYNLDNRLATIAKGLGVHIAEQTKVEEVVPGENFLIQTISPLAQPKVIEAKIACAAFGKRSNIDIKWKRAFLAGRDKRLNNYVGVKYHVETDWDASVIGLNNFENGYCGISKIEGGKCCLCYLTTSENLKRSDNSISEMEKNILMRNPHLQQLFMNSKKEKGFPVTISQISFSAKTQVENAVLMLGDAAGMITPLCGNGMSIALHTAKISATLIHEFLEGTISRPQMEERYRETWRYNFAQRLRTGRILQKFFGSTRLSNGFVNLFKTFPVMATPLIKMTHGKPF